MALRLSAFLLAAGLAAASVGAASAATFSFPTESSLDASSTTGTPTTTGYFFFLGHSISQSFSGTGLATIGSVDLELGLTYNSLDEDLGLALSLNGTEMGSFVFTPSDALGVYSFSLSGATVVGTGVSGDDYDVMLYVDMPVSSGAGSVAFATDYAGGLDLYAAAVPLPAGLPLLAAGLGAAGFVAGRRRR
ncbi:hypothetical protein [Poseidonocella sp. HB161398]|uniref:hypothetical protein n=1 Tax=Poseidonocella sp. HB161398 TaxID=2320855 RepID=UPI0011088FAD|nr:hypothetical protein [Poseidonocella sp. HB161398]